MSKKCQFSKKEGFMSSHNKEIYEQINVAGNVVSIRGENFFEYGILYCSDSGKKSIDQHEFMHKKNIFICGKRYGGK